MNSKKWLPLGAVAIVAVAITASAIPLIPSKTFRTTASLVGISQGHDSVSLHPQYDFTSLAGWNLINLAMGREVTNRTVTTQVLAMTVACDLKSASLVAYDKANSNAVVTLATTTSFETVTKQVGNAGPNRARFVALFQVNTNGTATDGLIGGFLTVAGRLHLDPVTGCPEAVLVALDKDRNDKVCGDKELAKNADPDEKLVRRTGIGHLIGALDLVSGGTTNTVLIPHGALSIRRELPIFEL